MNCPLYESDRISSRIDNFVHLMRRRDVFDLMYTLRGGIARNKFGLLHEGLFSRALAGTKVLVETYHNIICTSLEFVCDTVASPGDDPNRSKTCVLQRDKTYVRKDSFDALWRSCLGLLSCRSCQSSDV